LVADLSSSPIPPRHKRASQRKRERFIASQIVQPAALRQINITHKYPQIPAAITAGKGLISIKAA
jgi:hypothetical protein